MAAPEGTTQLAPAALLSGSVEAGQPQNRSVLCQPEPSGVNLHCSWFPWQVSGHRHHRNALLFLTLASFSWWLNVRFLSPVRFQLFQQCAMGRRYPTTEHGKYLENPRHCSNHFELSRKCNKSNYHRTAVTVPLHHVLITSKNWWNPVKKMFVQSWMENRQASKHSLHLLILFFTLNIFPCPVVIFNKTVDMII